MAVSGRAISPNNIAPDHEPGAPANCVIAGAARRAAHRRPAGTPRFAGLFASAPEPLCGNSLHVRAAPETPMAHHPTNKKSRHPPDSKSPTSWYKDAIIYQLHVRAFFDASGDGVGDFRGLAAKLDYIKDLGVNAIWLLPFYQSPLRDDGYDISDYTAINPAYGTLDDFGQFVEAAHDRDIRVITELVVNHSSDQHPWFQRARRAPPGSPERDYYVWSDSGHEFEEARIIFLDSEVSNWTWDPVAKAYYWHRFYACQPDLNFDNPLVVSEVK